MPRFSAESAPLQRASFVSFDGAVALPAWHQRPDRYRHLQHDLGTVARIARGGGYSYAAASFGEDVIVQDMRAFNRILAFDGNDRVRVEAGIAIGDLLEWTQRRELYPSVLPGYPLITVGGCIAADVHGKSSDRDGTFADIVDELTLYHPSMGFRSIGRAANPDLFARTCGGFGLTGVIVDATLRLSRLPANAVRVVGSPVRSFDEAIERLMNERSDFAYSWHNGAARKSRFGRGLVFVGEWADGEPTARPRFSPMTAASRAAWPLLWNRSTVRLANGAFRWHKRRVAADVRSLFDSAFPFARRPAYHRFFGKRGLVEVQLLIPYNALRDFAARIESLVDRVDPPLAMVSLKRFSGSQRSLSLSGNGMLIALDLIRSDRTLEFMRELDSMTVDFKAQPNVAKDSRLPSAVARRALPYYDEFRSRLREIDPDRLYQSELSRRLEL